MHFARIPQAHSAAQAHQIKEGISTDWLGLTSVQQLNLAADIIVLFTISVSCVHCIPCHSPHILGNVQLPGWVQANILSFIQHTTQLQHTKPRKCWTISTQAHMHQSLPLWLRQQYYRNGYCRQRIPAFPLYAYTLEHYSLVTMLFPQETTLW